MQILSYGHKLPSVEIINSSKPNKECFIFINFNNDYILTGTF